MFDLLLLYPLALIVGVIVGAFSKAGDGTRNGVAAGAIITGGVWIALVLSTPDLDFSDGLAAALLATVWGAALGAAGGWFGSKSRGAASRKD